MKFYTLIFINIFSLVFFIEDCICVNITQNIDESSQLSSLDEAHFQSLKIDVKEIFKNIKLIDEQFNSSSEDQNKRQTQHFQKIRNLQKVHQMRVTANFDSIRDATPYFQIKLIKRAFRLVAIEIKKILSIQSNSESDILVLIDQKCGSITYSINEIKNGIPQSDLHIYFTKYNPQQFQQLDKVIICQYDGNKRATVGIINLNFSNYDIKDEPFLLSLIAQDLFSQIYHLLALNKDLVARFVNEKGTNVALDKIIKIVQYELPYNILITNQIQQISRQLFNCDDIEGIVTEINIGKSFYFSKPFVNPQSLGANAVSNGRIYVSSIDLALLKDTGFYENVTDPYQQDERDLSLANQKGCDFYKSLCQNQSYEQNFCQQEIKKCDSNHIGIATCNQFDPQIPCKIYQVTDKNYFCFNVFSNYLKKINYYGNDSRCFESTLTQVNSNVETPDLARCLQNKCILNDTQMYQIQVQFNNETLICSQEGQKVSSVYNQGYIICPSNFQQFCLQNKQKCPNYCSKNGLCINGRCECYPGYSGDYCQIIKCMENTEFGCLECSKIDQSVCLKCQIGLYISIDKQECVQDCQIGQFIEQTTQSCKSCSEGCKYCKNIDSCLNCAENYYLNQNNQCFSKCSDGFFSEQIQEIQSNGEVFNKWICSKCHQACTTCFGYQITQCNGCKKYYNLIQPNTCQHPKCDSNYYALNNKICIQCPPNCLSCTAIEVCYRCDIGYLLINGKCQHQICKQGQIFMYKNLKCESCDQGCTQCQGNTSNCLSCQQNYYFWNNKCLQTCPYGFYKYLSSNNLPGNTDFGLNKDSLTNGKNNNFCLPCHNTCNDCIGPSQNDCSSCPLNYYLDVQKKQCNKSQLSNCIVALSETVCLQCDAYYYLQKDKCQPNSCSPNFYAERVDTLQGFLNIQPSYKCLPCQYGCEVCINASSCQKCQTGFYLNDSNDKCISQNNSCQSYQYYDFQTNSCLNCSNNCIQCRDKDICLACSSNYYLINYSCELPLAPPKAYYSQYLQQFLMCQNSCSSCNNYNLCTYCYDQTDVLYQNQCIHQCPSGYYKSANQQANLFQCKQCDTTCNFCSDQLPTSCIICKEDYDYYSSISLCLPQCSMTGYYYDLTKQKCQQCIPKCLKCENQNECIQCQQGMYYDSFNGSCSNCMEGCNICSNMISCQQCQIGTVYVNQQCQKICTVKDLYCLRCDPITNQCLECQSGQQVLSNGFCPVICNLQHCSRCSSSTQCGECEEGFYLDINQQCQIKFCSINFCLECNYSKYIPYCDKCLQEYQQIEDGTCSSKKCPQFGQQCQQCQNDQSCKICIDGFYYSKDYNQCLSCPDKCSSCDQYQCFQYNTCPEGQYLYQQQCLNCFEKCLKCNGPNKSDCLDKELIQNCHYTCKECLGTDYNQCISCPENRILAFYHNVKYGECMCPYGTYDTLKIKCMGKQLFSNLKNCIIQLSIITEGHLDQIQRDLTIGFSYLGAVGVIVQSLLSLNPAMFYLLSEFAQTLGQIQYINIKKAYDFDETVYVLQHFNYNILSGVGSNVKPKEQKSSLRQLEVRLEDLEKITSFYRTNNFLSNSYILIVLNAACFNLMLVANYLVQNKTLNKYKNVKFMLRIFRFSLPAFMLILTSSEMCVTIQLQMKKFDLDSDQIFALMLSIIFFMYQFIWIVIIIIQLGIKNSVRKKEHKLIFRIFNRRNFWQRIFLALLFLKKQFLSIILINDFKSPITLLFIQLITEAIFSIYIIIVRPYRGAIFKRFALLNQFTYLIVNIFLILISSNEDQQSETKPILYIFILSLIILALILYSIFSFYLIIKFVSSKVASNLTNRSEKTAILQKKYTSSITLKNNSSSENQAPNKILDLNNKDPKQSEDQRQFNNLQLVNMENNRGKNSNEIFITNENQLYQDEQNPFQSVKSE